MRLWHGALRIMERIKTCLIFLLCMHFVVLAATQTCASNKIPVNGNYVLPEEIAGSYNDKEQLRFSCQIGYTGFVRFTCANGNWIKSGRDCRPKQCGHPGDALNGDFTLTKGVDFVFGSEVQYTCKKGYVMMSRVSRRSCLDKGWDNSVPVCEAVKCEPVKSSDEMLITGNTEQPQYSDVIQFECRSNDLKLSSADQIYCTETGEWSGPIPKCEEIRCQHPEIPHSTTVPGDINKVYKQNDILRFTCEQNYIPVGSGTTRCTNTGWSQQPRCEERMCEVLYGNNLDTESFSKHRYKNGEKVAYNCESGFRKKTEYITCTEGVWEPRDMCQEITCSVTPRDTFEIGYFGMYGDRKYTARKYRYTCKSGYEKTEGTGMAECTEDGWKPDPLCQSKEKHCNKLDIQNGYLYPVKATYNNEEKVYYACLGNYKPSREGWWGEITCTNRVWSYNPKCIAEGHCGILPQVAHGMWIGEQKDEYFHKDTVQIECDNGYKYKKLIYLAECLNGNWELPECEAVKCEPLKESEELVLRGNFTAPQFNDTVYFECRSNEHKVRGQDWRRCTERGQWSGRVPECEEIRCQPPIIPNGRVEQKLAVYKNNDVLQFICEENYKPVGNGNIRCTKTGWSQQPQCKETGLPCEPPSRLQNAIILSDPRNTYNHKSKLTFKCQGLYTMEGKEEVECRNGNWGPLPRCIRINCEPPKEQINHAKLKGFQREQNGNGSTVPYECDEGFVAPRGTTATCINGDWNYPQCIKKNYCDNPQLKNGAVRPQKDRYENGEEIEFVCYKPYDSVPEGKVTCQDGQWTGILECRETKPLACEQLPSVDNGDRVGHEPQNGPYRSVTFQCSRSYKLEGKNTVRCQNGFWEKLPSCLPPCQFDQIPEKHNLQKPSSTIFVEEGKSQELRCKPGYYYRSYGRYYSTATATCKNGRMQFPTCEWYGKR